jgi:hypothetical protein
MKTTVKRMVLSGVLALSVAGGSLAPVVAGHAAAGSKGDLCPKPDPCPIQLVTPAGSVVEGGVLGDGARPGIASGTNRDASTPTNTGDASTPTGTGDVRDRSRAPHASPDGDASRPGMSGDF